MLNRALPPNLSDESGFSLIEMLVAILCGVVVTGALFTILEVSTNETSRLAGRVQATQLGRTTMTRIVDELRTSCISKEFKPIQEKSSESELVFISGTGQEAVLKKAFLHRITYSATEGTLVDKAYESTSGEWPSFKYSETPKTTTRIGEYIGQSGTTPVFQYFSYASASNSTSTTAGVSTLESTPMEAKSGTGLSKTNAEKAAGVLITFNAGAPEGKKYKPSTELSDQVTLAFSAPSAETPIVAGPCE